MSRNVVNSRRFISEETEKPRRISRGVLAEDYDGIGQYVLVSLSGSSVGAAYKARLGAGDFGTGQSVPVGTPVTVFSNRGQIEVLTLGAK